VKQRDNKGEISTMQSDWIAKKGMHFTAAFVHIFAINAASLA